MTARALRARMSTRPVAGRTNTLRCSYRVAAIAIALPLYACGDDSPQEPASPAPAQLAIGASFDNTAGGIREAYDRTDRLAVAILDSAEVRFERDLPFDPSAVQTRVQLAVPLRATTENFELELELRRGANAVFSGSAEATLSAGATFPIEIALQPVLAGVACAGEDIGFDAYGETMQVGAAALFVTGDTIPDRAIEWSSQDAAVATVESNGSVTAVGDGETEIQCAAGSFMDSRTVRVRAEVASVEVAPSRATVNPGGTQQFSATLRDRRDNVIGGRTVSWTSSDEAVATVTPAGIVTALEPGTARIDATSDGVTGNATLVVTQPPDAVTGEASAGQRSAALTGSVNPNGLATDYWFEWGTDPELETSTSTPEAEAGADREPVDVGSEIGDLTPGTDYYFRVVARSEAGTTLGDVVSFRTAPAAPTVATAAASDVGSASAVVNGTVNPNGESTVAWFEWSRIPSLDEFSATPRREVGSGSAAQPISASLVELVPNVTYYFRAAASNDAGTVRDDNILSFTPSLLPAAITGEASAGRRAAALEGTVNPNGLTTDYWFEWGTDPELETSTSTPEDEAGTGREPVGIEREIGGLTPGTDYYFRLVARSEAGTTTGEIESFRTAPEQPTVTTTPASGVDSVSAVLNGTVNPNGASTEAWFEWHAVGFLTGAQDFTTPRQNIGSGSTAQPFSASLERLTPNVTYQFRAVASNQTGTARGDFLTFTTSLRPAAITGTASVFGDSVFVHGDVNPNGLPTVYWFEWGTDPRLATFTRTPEEGLDAVREPLDVVGRLGVIELAPGTTYYYRVVARSDAGTTKGLIKSFRTAPPPVVVTGEASDIDFDTAVLNGIVNPYGYAVDYWFEWGTTPDTTTFDSTSVTHVDASIGLVPARAELVGLTSASEYYFRLVARTEGGQTEGEVVSFSTP